MEFQTRTVSTTALDIAVLEMGSGPLALCLHGFPDSAYTWRHLLPGLADAGYHAVAPFMRGYAPTGIPADGRHNAGALVADATALHDVLGGDADAVLIGHDWGAMTAYGAGAFAPERWRRLVALAVPPLPSLLGLFFEYAQLKRSFYIFLFQTALAEDAVIMNDHAFLGGLWRDWTSPSYDTTEDVAHTKDCLRERANVAAAIGYYRAMLDPSVHGDEYAAEQAACSRTAPQPTLYLHGVDDRALGAEVVNDPLSALAPGSRAEMIPGANHFLHLEQPEVVNPLILDWLAG